MRTRIGTSIAGTRVLAEGPGRADGEDVEALDVDGVAPRLMDTGEVVDELVAVLETEVVDDETAAVVKFMKLDPNLVSSVSAEVVLSWTMKK
jgi:hypothetical protein